jgi:hypothetical protein
MSKTRRNRLCAAACVAVAGLIYTGAACAGGRPDSGPRKWLGTFHGGWAVIEGDAADALDDNFAINGGVLYWPAEWPVGLQVDLGFSNFSVSNEAVSAINDAIASDPNNSGRVTDGEIDDWQLTVSGIWGPGDDNNGFYLTGGIGVYSLHAKIVQSGLSYYPPACDPWFWWWCVPAGVGPGSTAKNSDSKLEVGLNVGLGYSFRMDDGQVFVEAKYHTVNTDGSEKLSFLPITIGYRW